MDIEGILREIDAEIDKLQRVRSIVEGISGATATNAAKKSAKPRRPRVARVAQAEPRPEPRLIVLPPKQKREYHRAKSALSEPKALAAPVSNRPVFVPKPVALAPQPIAITRDESTLEAAMRQKLLG